MIEGCRGGETGIARRSFGSYVEYYSQQGTLDQRVVTSLFDQIILFLFGPYFPTTHDGRHQKVYRRRAGFFLLCCLSKMSAKLFCTDKGLRITDVIVVVSLLEESCGARRLIDGGYLNP